MEKSMKRWYGLAAGITVLAMFGCFLFSGGSAAAASQATGTARIVVKVVLTGTPKPGRRLQMIADPDCEKMHTKPVLSQEIEVGAAGALKNTLVYIDGMPGTYPAPTTPVTLDQTGCMYSPHVLGVMVNQPLLILNSDQTLHNIHALPTTNTGFNIGQPVQGMKTTRVFTKPEAPFRVKCDVHGWMSAFIGVFSHPFFGVSNDQGEVELKNLPAGTFQVKAWQESLGVQTQSVTVAAGETRQITFTFKVS
jgi:hypothetical protein